jgi:hypothetical protein
MEIKTTNYGVCSVKKNKYPSNGNLFLGLVDETGQSVANITTNVIPLAENEFLANVNNIGPTLWSEIVASGLFEETGEKVPSGYCVYPVCKLVKELA